MKQALQLKLGQQLALTPQLQQAIKLLQLSTVDLQQIIEETLESNALLERESEEPENVELDFAEATASEDDTEDLAVDTVWEDVLPPRHRQHPALLPRPISPSRILKRNPCGIICFGS